MEDNYREAAARSVLIVGRVKDEPEIRVICHVKSSLAPEGDNRVSRGTRYQRR